MTEPETTPALSRLRELIDARRAAASGNLDHPALAELMDETDEQREARIERTPEAWTGSPMACDPWGND